MVSQSRAKGLLESGQEGFTKEKKAHMSSCPRLNSPKDFYQ